MTNKFLTTKAGSYIKHFLTVFIGLALAEILKYKSVLSIINPEILDQLLAAALAAVLPVWLNSKNKAYRHYGKQVDPQIKPDKTDKIKP